MAREVALSDGTIVEGVPDSVTDAQVRAKYEAPGPRTGTEGLLSGVSAGIANYAAAPARLAALGARALGVPVSADPVMGLLNRAGVALPAQTEQAAVGRRVGEALGTSLPAAGLLGVQGLAGPAVHETVAGLTSGIGAEAGRVYGGETGAAVGGIAGAMAPFLAANAVQTTARGLPGGMRGVVDDFSAIGAPSPTVGQASGAPQALIAERTIGRLPGAQTRMRQQVEGVADAVQSRATRIAEGLARNREKAVVGSTIQRGISGFAKRFTGRAEQLWSRVDEMVPPETPTRFDNLRSTLRDITQPVKGSKVAEAVAEMAESPTLRKVAAIVEGSDETVMPYETMKTLRTLIGRKLKGVDLVSDVPRADLKRLYGALSDDMASTVDSFGPRATAARMRAERHWKTGLRQIDDFLEPLAKKKVPEQALDAVLSASKRGDTQIKTLFRSLKPSERNAVTAYVIDNMGAAKASAQNAAGEAFSLETFLTSYNNLTDGAKSALFRGPVRKEMDRLVRVAGQMRTARQAADNPSGTAQGLTNALVSVAAGGVAYSAGVPEAVAALASTMAASRGAAEIMTSPRVVRWFSEAVGMPVSQLPGHIDRLAEMVGAE